MEKGILFLRMLLKCFLRIFLHKKLIQAKFHFVMPGGNENFVKNLVIYKRSVNCIMEIAFKCPESIVPGLKSHQPIITQSCKNIGLY